MDIKMDYQYTPYIWPLVISGVITLFLGLYTLFKCQKAKGAGYFILSMFAITLWALPNALEMAATEIHIKLFWANIQYIAYCYSPVTLLALSMQFTGYDSLIKNKKMKWLIVIPTITIILVWTNSLHGLIRYDIHLDYRGTFSVIAKKYGFAFYVHALYSYCLNITAVLLLIKAAFFGNTLYRKQVIPLLIGICFIVFPNLFYITGISTFGNDITPIFFGPGGVLMLWSIFHYRMFDLVPMARATVMETMEAGVIVMDLQDRVLDMNPAFQKLVDIRGNKFIQIKTQDISDKIPKLGEIFKDKTISHAEFNVCQDGINKVYEIIMTPLNDSKNKYIGRMAVTHEITDKKQAENEYLKQQWRLAVIEERERMVRDMHDNLSQVLGFINFQAQAIRQELKNEGITSVECKLDRLIEVAQTTHTEIRDYIQNIRTSITMEKDFITSLKNEVEKFKSQSYLTINLDIAEDISGRELKPIGWFNILNIIKEALNNIRKHAEAKKVLISINHDKECIVVCVEDDGKGFDIIQYNSLIKPKFGLEIMRERASVIGGKIRIDSKIGNGTKIVLYVPIEEGR